MVRGDVHAISQSAPSASFPPEIALNEEPTRVLCEMAGAVDAIRLGSRVGHLALNEMQAVGDALGLVLDSGEVAGQPSSGPRFFFLLNLHRRR